MFFFCIDNIQSVDCYWHILFYRTMYSIGPRCFGSLAHEDTWNAKELMPVTAFPLDWTPGEHSLGRVGIAFTELDKPSMLGLI